VTRYDTIGRTYTSTRRADPRIAAQIAAALGDSGRAGTLRVVNVGAGAGSYEPADRLVVAADPSLTMLRQRPANAAPAVLSRAEALPFPDDAFDSCLIRNVPMARHHPRRDALGIKTRGRDSVSHEADN